MAFKFVMSYFGHDCLRNETCFCNENYFLFNEIIKAMATLKWGNIKTKALSDRKKIMYSFSFLILILPKI
jgi:hypothetical protein